MIKKDSVNVTKCQNSIRTCHVDKSVHLSKWVQKEALKNQIPEQMLMLR